MANSKRSVTDRKNKNVSMSNRGMYVDGSTARRLQEMPSGRRSSQKKRTTEQKRSAASVSETRTAGNRAQAVRPVVRKRGRAKSMNKGFVLFLAVVSIAVVFFCIQYLQLKSEITQTKNLVAVKAEELAHKKEENDAFYSQVTSNIDLERIKKIAIGRLGMKYPSDDQKMTYQTANNSYVRQYQDVPETK